MGVNTASVAGCGAGGEGGEPCKGRGEQVRSKGHRVGRLRTEL